jgi:peptide/nickel transport system ATP-binding protein/oligopeptide transport system ATP-binding protein
MNANLLDVRNLSVSFHTDDGVFKAVDNVSLHVKRGEIVGLIGESGCGKSVTSLGILKLIPSPPGKIDSGRIYFKGHDLLKLDAVELRQIRGKAISMIFQEPLAALSPLQRIGQQLVEALKLHNDISKKEAWALAEKWLEKVKIPDVKERMFAYPFQLSGGMQQRVMIAMAMMLEPDLIIADEPTTALDVTIQAKIFSLIKEMRQEKTSILLITHDMGVIWEMCDRVVVMYASRIAEEASKDDIFVKPAHPYTQGLLNSIPKLTADSGRLEAIPGQVPSPFNYPSGCHFRDRCPHAFDQCAREIPPLMNLAAGHRAACWIADKLIHQNNNNTD